MTRDCMRVYHDWITAYCRRDPKQLLCCATVQMGVVDRAFAHLSAVDREKVALTNAARLFKVDLPVDACGALFETPSRFDCQ